tara:strand:- start:5297 stop:5611 length:315 start_codon:yes stop_codon:yes gene_type:complete
MTEENKNNTSQSDWKKREIGALWRRDGKNQKFLSGKIKIGEFEDEKTISIVVFSNRFKEKDIHPDFRIYEDTPLPSKVEESSESIPENNSSSSDRDDDLPDILQ